MARCIIRMSSYLRSLTTTARDESGQMLLMGALLLTVLLGMTAMAVDLGGYASQRRDLQNAADSIALAAAQELPDEEQALVVAQEWAATNGVDWADVSVAFTAQSASNPNPKVRVVVAEEHDFAFITALGIQDADVNAAAAAVKTTPGGSANLVPWGVVEAAREDAEPGDLITLKYDANNVSSGDFGSIRIDGNGGSVYEDTITNGSTSTICAKDIAGCVDTSPVCSGYICPSQTGNQVGPTSDGVDYRMENTDEHCDTFEKVFNGPTDGKYTVEKDCNPWLDGGYENQRLVLVPIISSLCNGTCDLTILEFALFWLEGYANKKCTGNSCEIQGRFIDAELTTGGLVGKYDESGSVSFARLTE